jgi:hypothetical protein
LKVDTNLDRAQTTGRDTDFRKFIGGKLVPKITKRRVRNVSCETFKVLSTSTAKVLTQEHRCLARGACGIRSSPVCDARVFCTRQVRLTGRRGRAQP